MRPLTVLCAAALVAVPWFVLVAVKTDGEWLAQFVTKFNLGPFVKPFLGHRGPFYYHFAVVLVGLFPWSIFLGPTAAHAWRSVRAPGKEASSYLFIICWIGVFFGFWSVCSTKLPHYVLPAYPALAILTACFLDAWLKKSEAAARHVMPIATGIYFGVGVLMLAVLPWVAGRYVPGEQIIVQGSVGLGLVLGGGAAFWFLAQGRRPAYLATIAATSVMFIVTFFAWAALRIDGHQHSRPLLAAIYGDSPAQPQIAGYKYCDASTVYYAGCPVATLDDEVKLQDFVRHSPHPFVVTTGDGLRDLEAKMPGTWRIVARRPRFLSKGEIVVVAPRAAASELSRREASAEASADELFLCASRVMSYAVRNQRQRQKSTAASGASEARRIVRRGSACLHRGNRKVRESHRWQKQEMAEIIKAAIKAANDINLAGEENGGSPIGGLQCAKDQGQRRDSEGGSRLRRGVRARTATPIGKRKTNWTVCSRPSRDRRSWRRAMECTDDLVVGVQLSEKQKKKVPDNANVGAGGFDAIERRLPRAIAAILTSEQLKAFSGIPRDGRYRRYFPRV